MSLTPTEFRKAMGCFATGVTIITLDLEGEAHGMTANAFASVSLDPMLVLVCVDHTTRTHAHMHAKKRFGISVVSEDQGAIWEYYARPERTHQHAEAEAGARFDRTPHGTPILQGALAYLECRLYSAQDAGDHTIFIAEVESVVVKEKEPLLFFRGKYRKVGKTSVSRPEPSSGQERDVEQIIEQVRQMCPAMEVRQLKVLHPGADDDGLWFFNQPESLFEVQIESTNGMCPFLIETDETPDRFRTNSVAETVQILSSLLHISKTSTSRGG